MTTIRPSRRFCSNVADIATDCPLKLKKGMAPRLLALPEFRNESVADMVYEARCRFRGINVRDKAMAIALKLGTRMI